MYDDDLEPMGQAEPTHGGGVPLPLAEDDIQAGFPAPNGGQVEGRLDLNEYLITSPSSTYLYRVRGDSMEGAGINAGDFVMVDSSRTPRDRDIVVARVNDGYTVKELRLGAHPQLVPHNREYSPIAITEYDDVVIIGPVIGVVRKYQ